MAHLERFSAQYINTYLGKIDQDYSKYGFILYEMYRHGTVHNFAPQKIIYNGTTYKWLLRDGGRVVSGVEGPGGEKYNQVKHMRPVDTENGSKHLPISTECLVSDLEASIREFRKAFASNRSEEMRTKWNKHVDFLLQPKQVTNTEEMPTCEQGEPR